MFDVVFDKRLDGRHIGHFDSGNRFRGFYVYKSFFVVHIRSCCKFATIESTWTGWSGGAASFRSLLKWR